MVFMKVFNIPVGTAYNSRVCAEYQGKGVKVRSFRVMAGVCSILTASITKQPVVTVYLLARDTITASLFGDGVLAVSRGITGRLTAVGTSTSFSISTMDTGQQSVRDEVALSDELSITWDAASFDEGSTGSINVLVEYELVELSEAQKTSLAVKYA
jgi:hypothetical protein